MPSRQDHGGSLSNFDSFDMKLLYHFFYEIGPVLTEDGRTMHEWRIDMPEVVFAHQFVLHALLAISALHMSRQLPLAEQLTCRERAAAHCSRNLPTMIKSLDNVAEADCNALFIAAMFLLLYELANGPSPGQYLGFSDEGEAKWLWILRGIGVITTATAQRTMLDQWDRSVSPVLIPPLEDFIDQLEGARLLSESQKHFARLRQHISTLRAESEHFDKYLVALNTLEQSFETTLTARGQPASRESLAWMYRASPDFVTALQEKRLLSSLRTSTFCWRSFGKYGIWRAGAST